MVLCSGRAMPPTLRLAVPTFIRVVSTGQTCSEKRYWPRIRYENFEESRHAGEGADSPCASRTRRTSRSRSSVGGENVL